MHFSVKNHRMGFSLAYTKIIFNKLDMGYSMYNVRH